jgi:hypothetical protein
MSQSQSPDINVLSNRLIQVADGARAGDPEALRQLADEQLRHLGPRERSRLVAHLALSAAVLRAHLLEHAPQEDVDGLLTDDPAGLLRELLRGKG